MSQHVCVMVSFAAIFFEHLRRQRCWGLPHRQDKTASLYPECMQRVLLFLLQHLEQLELLTLC